VANGAFFKCFLFILAASHSKSALGYIATFLLLLRHHLLLIDYSSADFNGLQVNNGAPRSKVVSDDP